jgi:hypothetical protein
MVIFNSYVKLPEGIDVSSRMFEVMPPVGGTMEKTNGTQAQL